MRGLLFIQQLLLALLFLSQYTHAFSSSSRIINPIIIKRTSYSPSSLLSAKPTSNDEESNNKRSNTKKSGIDGKELRRSLFISTSLALVTNLGLSLIAPPGFKRMPTQFIAAIADPKASSGNTARDWGLWTADPGPRGVFLRDYEKDIRSSGRNNNTAPVGWSFDPNDWWLEEHGIIMEAPAFPLEQGRYLVTGGRLVTTVLEIGENGAWSLEYGELYDVTHLPCRSARYAPKKGGVDDGVGGPTTARESDFPVRPGAEMPEVDGCDKVDYAVLFVIGKEV